MEKFDEKATQIDVSYLWNKVNWLSHKLDKDKKIISEQIEGQQLFNT